jgi:hypothetical protein
MTPAPFAARALHQDQIQIRGVIRLRFTAVMVAAATALRAQSCSLGAQAGAGSRRLARGPARADGRLLCRSRVRLCARPLFRPHGLLASRQRRRSCWALRAWCAGCECCRCRVRACSESIAPARMTFRSGPCRAPPGGRACARRCEREHRSRLPRTWALRTCRAFAFVLGAGCSVWGAFRGGSPPTLDGLPGTRTLHA